MFPETAHFSGCVVHLVNYSTKGERQPVPSQTKPVSTGQELALVNNQASIITINILINHGMTSLQKNTHRNSAVC